MSLIIILIYIKPQTMKMLLCWPRATSSTKCIPEYLVKNEIMCTARQVCAIIDVKQKPLSFFRLSCQIGHGKLIYYSC